MKLIRLGLTLMLGLTMLLPAGAATLAEEVDEAIELFVTRDPGMQKFFDESVGYAVFPKIIKGGLGIGGARGKGLVFADGRVIGEAVLTQGTIGFQAGGQVYAEVIFFESQRALNDFKGGNFELSAQASAVAAAEGVSANARYEFGVLIFTVARGGLMYEASVGGQKFGFKPNPEG
ncbi:MAG: YSC84-related protein [Xanthomonadales bacterium]|nr:YSC84-related protein [Xanthomonadales bacterium]